MGMKAGDLAVSNTASACPLTSIFGKDPVMSHSSLYVGLDYHQDSVQVCVMD
jgi:hypothetical protein